jgi:hypothetical protein
MKIPNLKKCVLVLKLNPFELAPNSRTSVILLQIDPISSDEPEIIYKGF